MYVISEESLKSLYNFNLKSLLEVSGKARQLSDLKANFGPLLIKFKQHITDIDELGCIDLTLCNMIGFIYN